jgi:glycosyltransferase involved in cell wall biosynthesis
MPVYNGSAFLEETLQSVFAQTLLPSEIIVVDDASTDSSAEVIRKIAMRSPTRLRYIPRATNSGSPSRPMNEGIAQAASELIAVLDQDDSLSPHKLADEAQALANYPEAAFAFSSSAYYGKPSEKAQDKAVLDALRKYTTGTDDLYHIDGTEMLRLLLNHGCFVMGFPGFTFRKKHWVTRGGIDERLRIADHDFLCWLATQGSAVFVDRINYFRRLHEKNLSKDSALIEKAYVDVVNRYLLGREKYHRPDQFMLARDHFVGIAYALRDAGWYFPALRCHLCIASHWGWNHSTLSAILKLLPHWALRKVGSRP